jgi:hypothetical protein
MSDAAPRFRAVAVAGCAVALALTSAGCGYRIVHRDDVSAQRFAQDSATMRNLERQIAALRSQCHEDSVRFAAQVAAIRAQPAPPASSTPDTLLRVRDAEIASLKDQLTKANAELDRIKRRLATPRP